MRKGEFEINEMFIVLLLLIGVLAAMWVAGETGFSEEKQVKVTNKTMEELLGDGLAQAAENFFKANPTAQGNYLIKSEIWSFGPMEKPPDYIPNSENISIPNYPVLFDSKYLYEIRGFGAKVYERTDKEQPVDIRCFAIFLGKSDTLDNYYTTRKEFQIMFYTHNTERKLLENCTVDSYKDQLTEKGNLIRTYYMHCNVIWGGYY